MAQGKGQGQVWQLIAAMKQRLRNEADNLEKLERLIIDVYGKPPSADLEDQDMRVLEQYCDKWFVRNVNDVDEARSTFINKTSLHINKLGTLMSRTPKGHEVISEIERQFSEK